MKKTLIVPALLGGIIVFVWGVISWVILPWHNLTMHHFSNEKQVASAMQMNSEVSGVYVLPNLYHHAPPEMSKEERAQAMEKGKKLMKEGPFVFAVVNKEGMECNMTKQVITGFIIQIISAFLITWMLLQTRAMSYRKRVGFVTMFGLIAGFIAVLPGWNWWGIPCGYTLVQMLDLIIGWFLAGLLIAAMAKK